MAAPGLTNSSLYVCLSEVFYIVTSNKEAEHFRWVGEEVMGKYFLHTEAEVDLHTVEERLLYHYYTSAAKFRSD